MLAEVKRERFSRSKFLKSKQWSPLQQAIFDFGLNGTGHGFINAYAGAAKSTSLVGLVASLSAKSKIAVVAFNVHSVADLSAKMPSSVSVSTAHKFGMSSLFRFFGEPFKPNDLKARDLCRGAVRHLISRYSTKQREFLSSDIDLLCHGDKSKKGDVQKRAKALRRSAAAYLEDIIHFAMASLSPLDVESLVKLDDYFTIEKDFSADFATDYLLPMVEGLIDKSVQLAIDRHDVSLDELLYLPVRLELNFPAYDFVLQDEAQDASNVMQAMIERMVMGGGRLIAVADKFQAIQGFTGAAADSVDQIIKRFQPTELPLSICYRCPTSHLDLARQLVQGIEDRPGAPIGKVEVLHPDRVVETAQLGDLMICRFTAPLVGTCLDLISSGIKARVRGRDIGKQLTALVESVGGEFPSEFSQGLDQYCKPRIGQLKEDEKDSEAQSLEDRMMAVMTCFQSFGHECRSVQNFCDRIQSLFCDDSDNPPVTLSTIHRSKGDEADRVFILGSNFLPYTKKAKHEWQIQQELNLTYVALTRSKSELFLVPLGKDVEQFLGSPTGGMDLLEFQMPVEKQAIDPTFEDIEPQTFERRVKTNNGIPDGTFPIPRVSDPVYEVGMAVALYHNPLNAHKIIEINGDQLTVQRGALLFITVDKDRVRPLVPQNRATLRTYQTNGEP
jgi:UvrD-like helicase C-terminal domain/AAA domain